MLKIYIKNGILWLAIIDALYWICYFTKTFTKNETGEWFIYLAVLHFIFLLCVLAVWGLSDKYK